MLTFMYEITKKAVKKLSDNDKLIVLVGPTAVGKTELSIEIAKAFNGEIVSGDSMQIYRGMDIGTAKINKEEMDGVPHHLIDIKDPDEPFSVAEFQQLVRIKIKEIITRGHQPIIVGGTGLYIQAVLYDYQFSDEPKNEKIRIQLEDRVQKGETMQLYEQLQKIDPKTASNIHPNNSRRVIRALEVYYTTGKTMSEIQSTQKSSMLYQTALIGLTMDREKLYERINKRVDLMMKQGLLEEVKSLYNSGLDREAQSIKAIGYNELFGYLDGHYSLQEAVELLKKNSRNFAKRQLTWFRNKMDVSWFDMTDVGEELKMEKTKEIINFIAGMLEKKSNT